MIIGPKPLGRALVFALFFVLRVVALDADPPGWLSWSAGNATDEGFYTLDARFRAVFGSTVPGDFHDGLLTPILSVLQYGVFHVFGAGYVQARLISVFFGLATLVVLWLGLNQAAGQRAADIGTLLLGIAPPFVFYNRMALQDTPAAFWLTLAFCLFSAGNRSSGANGLPFMSEEGPLGPSRPGQEGPLGPPQAGEGIVEGDHNSKRLTGVDSRWGGARSSSVQNRISGRWALLFLAGVSAAVAVTFKAISAIVVLAILGVGFFASGSQRLSKRGAHVGYRPRSPLSVHNRLFGRSSRLAMPAGFALALAVYGIVWYLPHYAILTHFGTYYRVHQIEPHALSSVWLNVRRGAVGGERGVLPYLAATMPVVLLLAFSRVTGRRAKRSAAEAFLALWLLGGLLFCLFSSYSPSRYYVLFLPALAGLAGFRAATLRAPLRYAVVGFGVLASALWIGQGFMQRTYSMRDANRAMASLSSHAVVVGDFAPALCMETKLVGIPVLPGLANDTQPVERFGADYITVARGGFWEAWWSARYPNVIDARHRVATFSLDGSRHLLVDVYGTALNMPYPSAH